MKKTLALICCLSVLTLAACSTTPGSADISTPSPSAAVSPSATPEATPSEAERMTGIPGSYIKDIQLGVANFGMDDDSAQGAPDGAPYRWTASKSWNFPDTTVLLDYSITGDDDSQLISGSFGVTWDAISSNDIFCTAAETYLGYIATVPYDTSDTATAKQWVLDNIGAVAGSEPVSTTIGDALFTLSGTATDDGLPSSYLLQIQVSE